MWAYVPQEKRRVNCGLSGMTPYSVEMLWILISHLCP